MTREEWDRWQQKASGEISCTDLYLAKEELRIRELAFSCAVNLIASAIGNCEVKTFSDGRPKHGAEYYTWNVEPNFSQSSTAFWHKLVYQLYSAGEALVIPLRRDGRNQLLVADAWGASPFDPAKETEYTGVTVDGYQFGQTFRESDVLHFRMFHCNTKAVVDAMVNSYYKLFDTASRAFQWSAPGKHFKVHVSQVQAGADMVAPSDMMDGRVGVIREMLDKHGYINTPIMAYSAKFASAFYGPFREAADSTPSFGDRKTYQMDYHNRREALKEVMLDVEEGADIVMVKPAMAYGDLIRETKDLVDIPVASYSVSGEYSMIKTTAAAGFIDEEAIMCEVAASAYRAGTDIYITYFAKELAKCMDEGRIG